VGSKASVDALNRNISLPALGSEPRFFRSCPYGTLLLKAIGSQDDLCPASFVWE